MTHKELVNRMTNYLRFTLKNSVVMREFTTAISEKPDVIGFHGGLSTLIECKVSREDFRADKGKWFRQNEWSGVGDLRYYAAPTGVLRAEDMPDGWGLFLVAEHQIRKVVDAAHKETDKRKEVQILVSSIRRLQLSTAVFVEKEEV